MPVPGAPRLEVACCIITSVGLNAEASLAEFQGVSGRKTLALSPRIRGVAMATSSGRYSRNILLSVLSSDDLALLQPHFVREVMRRELTLIYPDQPIQYAWFLEGGVASIVAERAGSGSTEVGVFGREGFAGTPLLLGVEHSLHHVYIQVEGGTALRIAASRLIAATTQSTTLRTTLLRYIQTRFNQVANSAVSNAHQRIEGRLARWLLMCHDREDGDQLSITHKFMAMMIAADRTRVTLALHVIEEAGMIRATRGRVQILDRRGLEGLAGEYYGVPEAEYRRLIAPFGKSHGEAATASQ